MKKTMVLGICLLAAACGMAGIRWEAAQDIVGDSDVVTEGTLCYAFCWAGNATVNGVAFQYTGGQGYIPNQDYQDVIFEDVWNGSHGSAFGTGMTSSAGFSANYVMLMTGAVLNDGNDVKTVTLGNLTAGHSYLVQFWAHDARSDIGTYRYEALEDGTTLRYRNSAGLGQYVVGRFTAAGAKQAFILSPGGNGFPACAQVNAVQVRDLTPGMISWETPQAVLGDTDVNTEGTLVCALHTGSGYTVTVNGVTFAPDGYSAVLDRVGFAAPYNGYASSIVTNSDLISENYITLLTHGQYALDGAPATFTLKRLMVGHAYLVQLWIDDSRDNGIARRGRLDGTAAYIPYKSGNANNGGGYAIGRFIATAAEQTFTLQGFEDLSGKHNTVPSTQYNAIQIRDVTDALAFKTEWSTAAYAMEAPDVVTNGTLCYAYMLSGTGTDGDINTVPFKGRSSRDGLDNDVTFANLASPNATAFYWGNDGLGVYSNAVKGAVYTDGETTSTVTLKNLTPGRTYLAQVWVSDWRDMPGDHRAEILDETLPLYFRNPYWTHLGQYSVGKFIAHAATQDFTLRSYSLDTVAASSQLNALQVRDLGLGSYCEWGGGTSGEWATGAANWNDENGVSRTGTLWDSATNIAYFSSAAAATVNGSVAAKTVIADAALTVGGGTLTVAGEIIGPNCTVNATLGNESIIKSHSGSLTLNGSCPNLKEIAALAGTLSIGSGAVFSAPLEVVVNGAGTLDLGGNAVTLSWLAGTGTVANATAITLTNDAACTFGGVFSGDVVVTHTGHAGWAFSGTHTGTLAIKNEIGTVTLSAADTAPVSIDATTGATVELGGVQHTLAALSGAGLVADGTVAGTFTVGSAMSLTNVAFAAGAKAVLATGARMAFIGDASVGNLTIEVTNPMQSYLSGATTLLSTTGAFTDTPSFELGNSAFTVTFGTTESGSAYVLKYIGATVIKLK